MAGEDEFDAVADALYGRRPEEFTAARTEAEKSAKADGDKALAGQIKQLRKPTVAAWMVNLLARERPEQLEPLAELGAAFAEAQANLEGEQLRELSRQRHRLVAALVSEARKLAAAQGVKTTEASVRELEETLQATLADPAAAAVVQAGRLTNALQHTGFGPSTARPAVGAVPTRRPAPPPPGTARKPTTAQEPPPDELAARRRAAARRAAEQAVADAERDLTDVNDAAAEAVERAEELDARQNELAAQVETLEEKLRLAEEQLPVLRRDARKASRERDRAEAARDRAERALDKARTAVAGLPAALSDT